MLSVAFRCAGGAYRTSLAGRMMLASARYEPDVFVRPAVGGRRPPADSPGAGPLLVCEVLSPGSSRHDRITKRRACQQNAVPEYWIVDADAAVFEIWHPADERPEVVDGVVSWLPHGATTPFELDVAAFFVSVADGAELG